MSRLQERLEARRLGALLRLPWIFGLVYLAGIPIFAAVYYFTADGFYQSTSAHEVDFGSRLNHVRTELVDTLNRSAASLRGGAVACVVFDQNDSPITSDGLNLVVPLAVAPDATCKEERSVAVPELAFTIRINLPQKQNILSPRLLAYVLDSPDKLSNGADPKRFLLPYPVAGYFVLDSTKVQDLQLLQLFSAINGNVGALPNRYARLFYLSAVTITTLGFGDIVPVTKLARILVSLEAIYGVIAIGLFLGTAVTTRSNK
ncbi:hypothetical protein acdb102_22980 [Acidothermaceae bacterium B102]|nr:hypothetical protein acdb102_22980 [Acidothermaceae bacterium B102]